MSEWVEVKLGTLSDLIFFGNGKLRPKTQGAIPVYGGNGILGYTDSSNYEGQTIVIGRVGAYCGATYFENQPIWVSDNALAAKAKNSNDLRYLYYLLKNLNLNQYALGSSHPLVTQTLLNSIEVAYIENQTEQRAIASVLSSLDDKIDLLHRQNKTLEAMAETLFRQWFVEEKEEGWEEKFIGDMVTVKGGTTPSTKNLGYWDGDIHWTSPRDLSSHLSVFLFNTERRITKSGLERIGSGLIPKGSILLSSRAPIGYLAINEIPLAINQGYIAIICDKEYSNYFIFLWCKVNMEKIKNAGNGSTFEEISKSNFKGLLTCVPNKNKLKLFNEAVSSQFEKIRNNQIQINNLEKLRNALLPKLMSGEIRISY